MSCCPCFKPEINSFGELLELTQGGFSTQEGRCELVGYKYCDRIDKNEVTLQKAVQDIILFTRKNKSKPEKIQLSWLGLHLALGLCYQYKSMDKVLLRGILTEMLKFSHGIDLGLFMRDLLHYEDPSAANDAVAKSMYVIGHCAGFRVTLTKENLGDSVLMGPSRIVYKELLQKNVVHYFDLPTGHPTLSMSANAPPENFVGQTCMFLACENLKPKVVLVLLQHGASPTGAPLDQLLQTLGGHQLVVGALAGPLKISAPINIIQECLRFCLRAIPRLNVRFDGETVSDLRKKNQDVYFLKREACGYMPDDCYKDPSMLKHLARFAIRKRLLENDLLPSGIDKLPKLTKELVQYMNLLS
ncbi:Ankyrin repeat and SOCS box protein 17 [Mizuhopecten yessoensis]|uniref:Ankyrin repeat and SOCS box protein 17 n=1 Tax=Mizuhopecten yessoensis TaxID=6573 RepID=A0A210R4E0_MIZYE|nr:Ankyrin repeat and SOCS box protein 17 [Mizuhopecten yessoensis]